jgi:hypothetical protein
MYNGVSVIIIKQGYINDNLPVIKMCNIKILLLFMIFSGSAAQRGLWLPGTTRFLDHTQRRATVGRTPLDE